MQLLILQFWVHKKIWKLTFISSSPAANGQSAALEELTNHGQGWKSNSVDAV